MGGMVWSAREWQDGVVTLIEVGEKPLARCGMLGLASVRLVNAEIWGQEVPPQ